MKRKYRKYEKRVREEFEAWLKKCHRDWLVSKKPIKTEKFPSGISVGIKEEEFPVVKIIKEQSLLELRHLKSYLKRKSCMRHIRFLPI